MVILDLLLILSVVVVVVRLAARGSLTVQQAGTILVLFVALLAISRRIGKKGIGGRVARVLLPFLGLFLLLVEFGAITWTSAIQVLAPLAMLLVVLYGFFVMFGGASRSKKN